MSNQERGFAPEQENEEDLDLDLRDDKEKNREKMNSIYKDYAIAKADLKEAKEQFCRLFNTDLDTLQSDILKIVKREREAENGGEPLNEREEAVLTLRKKELEIKNKDESSKANFIKKRVK